MSRDNGTRRVRAIILAGLLGLSACGPMPVEQAGGRPQAPAPVPPPTLQSDGSPESTARTFIAVMRRMEPAVERECMQRRSQPINCDFQFVVDDRAGLEPNAFQTVDSTGRPIIGFTLSLIAATRNADELAFVVGHEASHHIHGHLDQKTRAATAGAVLGSILGAYSGDATVIRTAQEIGASISARRSLARCG